MRFLIYGAGALGQTMGCMLAADGQQVDLVLRERFAQVIRRSGLRVTGIFGEYGVDPGVLGIYPDLGGIKGADYDYVLLTTKAYDTHAAVEALGSVAGLDCPVVSLQNGCGNVECLLAAFGPERTLGGRVITGFEIPEAGQVRITVSADAIHIGAGVAGSIPTAATRLSKAIDRSGLPCLAVADVHQSLFAKLLYNCALNPLGAVLGVRYGLLAEQESTVEIMNQVIDETFAVITALGGRLPWGNAAAYRSEFYQALIPATRDHRPSMLQDLEHGKPTEVEALVGYVESQGRAHGVPTPASSLLAGLVRFKEKCAAGQSH